MRCFQQHLRRQLRFVILFFSLVAHGNVFSIRSALFWFHCGCLQNDPSIDRPTNQLRCVMQSDIRVRHREEHKNVTRLTMENVRDWVWLLFKTLILPVVVGVCRNRIESSAPRVKPTFEVDFSLHSRTIPKSVLSVEYRPPMVWRNLC